MLKFPLLARVFAPVAAAAPAAPVLPGPAPVGPAGAAPAVEQYPTRDEALRQLAAERATNVKLVADRLAQNSRAIRQAATMPAALGCRRCAALEQRLLELQAVNEHAYRAAYDQSGGPRLDPGQPFGEPAARINLMKGL